MIGRRAREKVGSCGRKSEADAEKGGDLGSEVAAGSGLKRSTSWMAVDLLPRSHGRITDICKRCCPSGGRFKVLLRLRQDPSTTENNPTVPAPHPDIQAYMLRHWRTMTILLLPAMLWGWFISALFMYALFPKLHYLSALLIAAAVTPTDPILAQSVIGGKFADKHVPAHVRHMLSAESGSNDGAAFPFMYIALYLTLDRSPGHAVGHWFYATM